VKSFEALVSVARRENEFIYNKKEAIGCVGVVWDILIVETESGERVTEWFPTL
jgi:hypothetical protein